MSFEITDQAIVGIRPRILMNRPLIIGFTILEISKLNMYRFYYEALLPRYGDRLRLCFTDIDSFIFWVQTPDLHADMADMASKWLDTSNFPPDHPLFSNANKHKFGFFKSETGAHFASQLCATIPCTPSPNQRAYRKATSKNTCVTSNTYMS